MYLSRLIIKNFRSIESVDIPFQKGRNVIVGKNNSGKSNIIKALDIVLGENSPTYIKSDNICSKDFYIHKKTDKKGLEVEESKNNILIACVLDREDSEKLDYNQIDKCYGFYKHKQPFTDTDFEGKLESLFNVNPDDLDRNDKYYLNPKLKNQQPFKDELDDKNQFAFIFQATKDRNDKVVSKDIRFLYRIKGQGKPWNVGFTAPIRNELLQSAIIPSFRDPQSQLRLADYTWYGKLMRHLTENSKYEVDLKSAFLKVKDVADKIFSDAQNSIHKSTLEIAFPDTQIHFQFNNDTKADIYKSCNIYIDDGIKTLLTDKGSGIQSAAIIGLFNYYTKEVNTKTSALLCLEEPEIYLHPHARRVISDRLDDFTDCNKNQVILTTHSAEFIRSSCGLNIISVRKQKNEGTKVKPISFQKQKSLFLDDHYNEVFFADKVIVCEGYDEYILKWVDAEKFNNSLNSQNVSVISAGGKDNLSKMCKVIKNLDIPCFIFTDFDYLLRDESNDADKNVPKGGKSNKHQSIVSLGEDYFSQKDIFSTKGKTEFANLQKLRSKIKKKDQNLFYNAKSINELSGPLKKETKLLLQHLRQSGVCVLNCDLEDLSKDPKYLSRDKKFDQVKVFDLSSRIVGGEKISDIIDTSQIEEFFIKVFSK